MKEYKVGKVGKIGNGFMIMKRYHEFI